jgi:hypothetical protein
VDTIPAETGKKSKNTKHNKKKYQKTERNTLTTGPDADVKMPDAPSESATSSLTTQKNVASSKSAGTSAASKKPAAEPTTTAAAGTTNQVQLQQQIQKQLQAQLQAQLFAAASRGQVGRSYRV